MTGLKDTDKNKEWQFAALLLSGAKLAFYSGGGPSGSCTDLCGIMQALDLLQLWTRSKSAGAVCEDSMCI